MSKFQNWIFQQMHGKKLIYNTCWEDPRCDRKLLQLQPDSQVVMITSAGDNALEYLLDNPTAVHCVDMNFRQNALLELKRSSFIHSDHATLFQYFGIGKFKDAKKYYHTHLRPTLPQYAQKYWDKHIRYFSGKGLRKSFYYRGASGMLAYLFQSYLQFRKTIRENTEKLLASQTIQEQVNYYRAIEEKLFNPISRTLLNNHYAMYLAGVPKAQQALIHQHFEGGPMEYMQTCFRNIFTELQVSDNYFYQVYYRGAYTTECCPAYLKAENFPQLHQRQKRISTHTQTLSDFLIQNPGSYSHFVLLDHQDWLAAHDVPALELEWKLILENSRPGTRILLRSAAQHVDFFPDFVHEKVIFDTELTSIVHKQDRVGTYASVYLGIVK